MAPVLFLDLDGVVCCNFRGELERDKLLQVKRICEEANAVVVLSTDWRRRPDLKQRACQTLAAVGVEVIGSTPEYALMSRVRPLEILAWMKDNRFDQREGWCAVDDRDLVLEDGGRPAFTNHFVLTEFMTGLTPGLANQCIQRLRPAGASTQTAPPPRGVRPAPATHQPPPPAPSPARDALSAVALPATKVPPRSHASSTPVAAKLVPDGSRPLNTLRDLLHEAGLESLLPSLLGVTLLDLHEYLHGMTPDGGGGGRVALLAHLRAVGVGKIGDRQAVANAFGKAQRLGRIGTPPALESSSSDGRGDHGFTETSARAGDSPPPSHTPAPPTAVPALASATAQEPASAPVAAAPPRETGPASCSSFPADRLSLEAAPATLATAGGHLTGYAYSALAGAAEAAAEAGGPASGADGANGSALAMTLPPAKPKDEVLVRICPPHSELSVASGLLALQPGATQAAIVLHPHPGRGGDMYNPFVVQAVQLAKLSGISTLRFNFSRLEGMGDDETEAMLSANCDELMAAMAMIRLRAPNVSLALIGYSYGALVGLAAARKDPARVQALGLVAPPIDAVPEALGPGRRDFTQWPVLLVCGDKDEYCSAAALTAAVGDSACTTLLLPGVGHFLQGDTATAAARHAVDWLARLRLET
jgi:alpha/beta superfamily hydrolase